MATGLITAIVGLLGVPAGAVLSARNMHHQWIRDTRLRAYHALVMSLDEIQRTGTELTSLISVGVAAVDHDPASTTAQDCVAEAAAAQEGHREAVAQYKTARAQFELVGHPDETPSRAVSLFLVVSTPWPYVDDPTRDLDDALRAVDYWQEHADERRGLRTQLISHARQGLGVDKRPRVLWCA